MANLKKFAKNATITACVGALLLGVSWPHVQSALRRGAELYRANPTPVAHTLTLQEQSGIQNYSLEAIAYLGKRFDDDLNKNEHQMNELFRKANEADLAEIAKQSAPYISRELSLAKVNLPPIKINEMMKPTDDGSPYPLALFKPENRIELMPMALTDAEWAIAHEQGHAQYYVQPLILSIRDLIGQRVDEVGGTLNETFVQVLTLEVLANKALDGNMAAKRSLITTLSENSKLLIEQRRGKNFSELAYKYNLKPAEIVIRALNGQDVYQGIKLDGLVKFLGSELYVASASQR